MTREEYANMLLPKVMHDRAYYEEKYKKRNLPNDAMVTRIGPSPTGFVHIGTLYQAIVANRLAKQSGGVCFLRVEDTDQKRLVENGIEQILDAVKNYQIPFDEYPIDMEREVGEYGPYIQSKRVEIYQAFVKDLIIKDLAYPSFLTDEEKEEITEKQKKRKQRIGYYGIWASAERSLTMDEVKEKVEAGIPYVIRLKSKGSFDNKIIVEDCIKGKLEFPENDMDHVLLKSDGIPTYHFAHAVDDTLMGTTHVTRGDEWLSSLPLHMELFHVLGFEPPKYAHLATIQKEEDGKRRKISKRKDPEANVKFYSEQGIPVEAVKIYLLTLANSNFEEWFLANPDKDIEEFKVTFDAMSTSGALFDMEKLLNISRNYLSRITAEQFYKELYDWASVYDKSSLSDLENYKDIIIATLNIERNTVKPRKDYGMYSEVLPNIAYMYGDFFPENYEWQKITDKNEIKEILNTYIENYYDEDDTEEVWFNKMKSMCDALGYASNMKEYKKNPENFKGNVADVSTVIRVALTGKSRTPNLYDIMKILGVDEIKSRIQKVEE
ncbi:TPA: glutamate--tRNA ligase [Candidatus Ventrenecus stercoripullorum]|nr:glutamate--tRNA ligase [Candidatus Ventrenecus stercoripullorum]